MRDPTGSLSLQEKVRKFINHKYVDFTVIILIFLSVMLLVAEHIVATKVSKIGKAGIFFDVANGVFTFLFAVELSLRWYAQKSKWRFVRIYWIDIIAVLAPMFRSLRFLRTLRLLRMFRMGKLLNRRFNSIQSMVHHGVAQHFWMILILVTLIIAGAVSYHLAEGSGNSKFDTFGKALWWSIFTMVGGEPLTGEPAQTLSGRLITLFVMIAGLITFAALTGIIAAVMINKLKPQMAMGDLDLQDLDDHIVICGYNRALPLLIQVLQNSEEYHDRGIVLVAEFEDEPDLLLGSRQIPSLASLYVVKGDFTRTDVLRRAGIKRANEAIILADKCKNRSDQDRDARTLLAALLIEKMNPDIFTCVKLLNRDNAEHIKYAGVEEILVADDYAGPILANAQRTRGLIPMLDELFNPSQGNQFYKLEFPPSWIGRSVGEVYQLLKNDYNATLISLETVDPDGNRVVVNPDISHEIRSNDRMVVIANRYPQLVELESAS